MKSQIELEYETARRRMAQIVDRQVGAEIADPADRAEFQALNKKMGDLAILMQAPDTDAPPRETWVNAATGQPIHVLSRDQRMADVSERTAEPLSLGKYLKGLATGRWDGAELEHASMTEGSLGGGGYDVPSPLADNILDRARNATAIIPAGAQTVVMDSQKLDIAKVVGDATATWHAELGAVTPSDMTLSKVGFVAQTLVALVTGSVEVFEDANNLDQVVGDALARVLAIELDRAGLRGSGTLPEPCGVRFQSGVSIDTTTFTANGALISATTPTGAPAWQWLSKAVAGLWAANENPSAVIWHPRTAGEIDGLVDSTGQPLRPLPSCDRLLKLSTASLPIDVPQGSSNDTSEAYLGDYSQLLIGLRRSLVLEVSREATVGSTSMFSTMQVAIRAYMRADIQLARSSAFRVVCGIK